MQGRVKPLPCILKPPQGILGAKRGHRAMQVSEARELMRQQQAIRDAAYSEARGSGIGMEAAIIRADEAISIWQQQHQIPQSEIDRAVAITSRHKA